MNTNEITNWYGLIKQSIATDHAKDPANALEVQQIVNDVPACPSPLRPIGSNHSITKVCVAADAASGESGTVIRMAKLGQQNQIRISADRRTVTVPAGLQLHDLALMLRDEGLQLPINPEIGNISMGAAACAGTKDSSFPNESGQLSAFVVSMTLVTPQGEIRTVNENHPDLALLRSSYGLLGIVTELTLKIRPHTPIRMTHTALSIGEFRRRFQTLTHSESRRASLFLYLSPHGDLRKPIVLEKRVSLPQGQIQIGSEQLVSNFISHMANGLPDIVGQLSGLRGRLDAVQLGLRNLAWKLLVPQVAHWSHKLHSAADFLGDDLGDQIGQGFRDEALDVLDKVLFDFLTQQLNDAVIDPVDQIIDFPDEHDGPFDSRFTFSFWAFPEARFPQILQRYFRFCKLHQQRTGFRCKLPSASYRMNQDQTSLLSPTFDGPRWTIDPVTTGPIADGDDPDSPQAGLDEFLLAFNDFAISHQGLPLLNQTPMLTPEQVQRAFGSRLTHFQQERRRLDPENRLLNSWFAQLLGENRRQRVSNELVS